MAHSEGSVAFGKTSSQRSDVSGQRACVQCTGFIDNLSPEQERALVELRRRLKLAHPRYTDVFLLRFLRARKFDLDAAASMLATHLEFRQENNLDLPTAGCCHGPGPPEKIFPELQAIKTHYPHAFHSTDRQGRPVYIEQLGKLDIKRLLSVTPTERLLQYFTHEFERQTTYRLPACSLGCGRLVETSVTILDLQGLGFGAVTHATGRKMVQALTQIQQNHFPESLGVMVIVNAPKVFSMAWSFIKPMLDVRTVEKIQIFASEPAKYTKRLLELVAPENLPVFLGGTCNCPQGCMNSDVGPWRDPAIMKTMVETPHWEVVNRFACRASASSAPAPLAEKVQNGDEASLPRVDENSEAASTRPSEHELHTEAVVEKPSRGSSATALLAEQALKEPIEHQPAGHAPTADSASAQDNGVVETEAEALPEGWATATDPSSGKLYYFNGSTGESRWQHPAAVDLETAQPQQHRKSSDPFELFESDDIFGTEEAARPNDADVKGAAVPTASESENARADLHAERSSSSAAQVAERKTEKESLVADQGEGALANGVALQASEDAEQSSAATQEKEEVDSGGADSAVEPGFSGAATDGAHGYPAKANSSASSSRAEPQCLSGQGNGYSGLTRDQTMTDAEARAEPPGAAGEENGCSGRTRVQATKDSEAGAASAPSVGLAEDARYVQASDSSSTGSEGDGSGGQQLAASASGPGRPVGAPPQVAKDVEALPDGLPKELEEPAPTSPAIRAGIPDALAHTTDSGHSLTGSHDGASYTTALDNEHEVVGPDESENEYILLLEELKEAEAVQMQTMAQWVRLCAELSDQIGLDRIEKAQRYYDGLAMEEYAKCQLESLTVEFQGLDVLQPEQRDSLHCRYTDAMTDLRNAQTRMNELRREHKSCGRKCSVIVAKRYFESRARYDGLVEQQMKQIESLHRRLATVHGGVPEGVCIGGGLDRYELMSALLRR